MDKYFMWIHYERLHNHNKAKHNKTVCIFLGIYCKLSCLIQCKQNLSSTTTIRYIEIKKAHVIVYKRLEFFDFDSFVHVNIAAFLFQTTDTLTFT